jgi:hypothetical protein
VNQVGRRREEKGGSSTGRRESSSSHLASSESSSMGIPYLRMPASPLFSPFVLRPFPGVGVGVGVDLDLGFGLGLGLGLYLEVGRGILGSLLGPSSFCSLLLVFVVLRYDVISLRLAYSTGVSSASAPPSCVM